MAKHIYTLGLSQIKTGDIAADGGMGQSLAVDGYTYQDTAQMVTNDATVTDFFAEEVDDPVVSIERAGTVQFNWSLMDPTPDTLVKYCGGAASKSDQSLPDNDTWTPPTSAPVIEKSVEITPQQGLKFQVPRMRIRAKLNGNFSKSALLLLEVQGTVLIPEKDNVAKLTASIVSNS